MKEKYVKPSMIIERFTLTSTIANNCADFIQKEYLTLSTKGSCGWNIGGGFTVFERAPVCMIESNDWVTDSGDIICYNNPVGGANIFGS